MLITFKKRVILLICLILSISFVSAFSNRDIASFAVDTDLTAPPTITPLESIDVPILVYHYVEIVLDEKDTIRKSLNTPPYLFIEQIETLKNAGYAFVTASELIDILDGKIKLPQKPVLITFDDGYRDFYTDVFPILKKYKIKAVAYVVSGFLDKPNYLFTWQLKELAQSGLVEIGAHTVNHKSLKDVTSDEAKYEIIESKKQLEKLINKPVVSFAYPNGKYDNQAIKLVEHAGFKSATTTNQGFEINHTNKYSAYRIRPGSKTEVDL